MDIFCVLSNFYKGQQWSIRGDEYDGLKWNETNTLPKPTLEEIEEKWNEYVAAQPLKELRQERNKLLTQTDRYATLDFPHSNLEVQQTWFDYRQALRDLPTVAEDPANPVWPTAPSP
tara:strand:- start:24 stop:374 length:351 start_codon:yes stop_codon:yes gene_type:complete